LNILVVKTLAIESMWGLSGEDARVASLLYAHGEA